MRRLKIEHLTTYEFTEQVKLGPHKLMIRPREGHDVRIESSQLRIRPTAAVKWHRDFFGNSVGAVTFRESSSTLFIGSEVIIQHYEENPLDFLIDPGAIHYPFEYPTEEWMDLGPYRGPSYESAAQSCREWVSRFWRHGQVMQTFTLLDAINQTIAREFRYTERHAEGVQTPDETLRSGAGSCRDFATLFIETCRALNLPARFVSGYLCSSGTTGPGGSMHAWAEVYLPGAGWKGFDSTLGEVTGSSHIAAAVSRHPAAVSPVSGSFFGTAGRSPVLLVGVRTTVL
ncbi:MAG: transglutaminase family protein [Verrucomicrobiales bacterium]|nr:transglutaminase family protein [Verrucomicrobiales bacterium]